MKAILQFFRHARAHKGLLFLNFGFNLLFVVLQLVTLLMIMPVLKFLFKPGEGAPAINTRGFDAGGWFAGIYSDFIAWFGTLAKGEPFTALAFLCVALVVLTVVKNLSRFMAMSVMAKLRNLSIRDMRMNIYNRCLDLPVAYFNEEKKGDLLSRMSNDMKEIEFAFMVSLEALYMQPLTILLFLGTLIVLSPVLTLYIILFLPVTALVIGLVSRSLRRKSTQNQEMAGRLMSSFEETIGGMRIIKAFNAAGFFRKRYSDYDLAYTRNNTGVQRRYDLSSPLSETIGIGVSAALLWLGGSMVFRGELNPEFFLTYFAIFSQLINPFKALSTAYSAAVRGQASLNRIHELVNAPVVVADPIFPKKPVFARELELRNVSFGYNQQHVLHNISLHIQKGQTIALVGPSGAGKTTLTDLIARFYDVADGNILLDGMDIREFAQDDLRRLIGIVSQESVLFNDSIRNNIALGLPDISEEKLIAAAQAAHAHEFILQSGQGYDTNIGERGSKLSGGQRQRLGIARALLKNPEILILDEATSALDSKSEKAVQAALETLMQNRTSIIIAHRLSTVTHADSIVVMDKGRIVEQGTHQELLAQKGLYFNLIQLQQLA
ncbi:MAG: ABC transporter ATP-binding protein [Bacteroidetes bacterium]|nr:ABC transporter ATP-binding protein [Bacteroidota bacterium]